MLWRRGASTTIGDFGVVTASEADILVSIISHVGSLIAFAALTAVLVFGGNRSGAAAYLTIACATTAAWSGSVAISAYFDEIRTLPDLVLETLRNASWIAFLYRLLEATTKERGAGIPRWSRILATVFFVSMIVADALSERLEIAYLADYTMFGRLITPIIALTLIENLARTSWQSSKWSARFLFVGIGGIFAFDLLLYTLYSEALLFRHVNLGLYAARGAVDLIAVPLFAISFARNPTFTVTVHVSRQFVFHTMTLIGTGVYLLMMAVAGYYLRHFGGRWGTILQATFLSAAVVLAFLTLSSGRFRSSMRNFVSANFFSYKYDYRHEWLRFIRLISAQESLLPLHDRVIEAIANIVDSPAGALWVERTGSFVNTAVWNAPQSRDAQPPEQRVIEWFEAGGQIADLSVPPATDADARPPLPDWLSALPRARIVVPLIHRHGLIGLLVLAAPRATRKLDAEDYDLLSTAGGQAASYIAEEEAGRALMDVRQLQTFNQRFAFVVHDIKNLVSQLSLILSNVKRHGDNPEFQQDVIATVRHSVARMKGLLEQLNTARRGAGESAPEIFDLAELVRRDWLTGAAIDERLHVEPPTAPCRVIGEPEPVSQVLRHLVQNALEATDERGRVALHLASADKFALVKVADNGPGMSAEFIRDELFRPFGTTKTTGYGIGAYQARELIHRMGGRLEVASTPGVGTEVSIHLPLAAESTAAPRQVQEA
jgi:putative PEP-CTERM system histidine kinase